MHSEAGELSVLWWGCSHSQGAWLYSILSWLLTGSLHGEAEFVCWWKCIVGSWHWVTNSQIHPSWEMRSRKHLLSCGTRFRFRSRKLFSCGAQSIAVPCHSDALLGLICWDPLAMQALLGILTSLNTLCFLFELRHKDVKICCYRLCPLFLVIQNITFQACQYDMILKCQIHMKT